MWIEVPLRVCSSDISEFPTVVNATNQQHNKQQTPPADTVRRITKQLATQSQTKELLAPTAARQFKKFGRPTTFTAVHCNCLSI
jgi:hypothetical protein